MSYRYAVFAALLGLTMLAQPRPVEAAEVVHTIQFTSRPAFGTADGGCSELGCVATFSGIRRDAR